MNPAQPSEDFPIGHQHRKVRKTASPSPTPTLSASRKRLFFVLTISFPLLLVLAVELGLRAIGYGPDLSLFTTEVVNGTRYQTMNPMLGARYFTPAMVTPAPSTEYFKIPKPPGTFRIFCLGGSTVVGYPYWHNASFASFLRERLLRVFAERSIEVINLGMTAVNSYTVADIERELPSAGADLLIVYDGHNEFYGAMGVASRGFLPGYRPLSLLYMQLLHSRLFMALRDLYLRVRAVVGGTPEPTERGPTLEFLAHGQLIPYGSPLYHDAERVFEANLEDLCSVARDHRIPIIFGTQVCNLRDLPPFSSGESAALPADRRLAFMNRMAQGRSAVSNGSFRDALAAFREATAIDTLNAGARYSLARCLDTLAEHRAALAEYVSARDYDQLRFRTSSDFNALIRRMDNAGQVVVVDLEKNFEDSSPDSLIGNVLIIDHLHPNVYGNFLMAKAFADAMRRRGLIAGREEWRARDTVTDAVLWTERPVALLDERVAARRTEILKSGWPFSSGGSGAPPVAADDTLGQIAENVAEGLWGWGDGHEAAMSFFAQRHDHRNLEREYRALINLVPLETQNYIELARLCVAENRLPEAEKITQSSLSIAPTGAAFRMLGEIALRMGRADQAVGWYAKLRGFPQSPGEQAENGFLLAYAYLKADMPDQAEEQLVEVLSRNPGYKPAASLLGVIRKGKSAQR